MSAQPKPLPLDREIGKPKRVEQHQRLNCINRDECLTTAMRAGWLGFTCNDCSAHQPETPLRAEDFGAFNG